MLLAVDGGLQVLGSVWYIGDEQLEGLGLLKISNGREEGDARHVGDIAVKVPMAAHPVVGFENHAGVTLLGAGSAPFGEVLHGIGNNAGDNTEGILVGNVVGTYVHGPILGKNPELADWLIARALERKGRDATLAPLDDAAEIAANDFMCKRLSLS